MWGAPGHTSFSLSPPSLDICIFVSSPGESNMQLGLQPTGQPKYISQCVRGVREEGGWHANQWFPHFMGVQQVSPRGFLSDICPGLVQMLWMEGHRHSWCFSVLKDRQSRPMTSEKMHCWALIRFAEAEPLTVGMRNLSYYSLILIISHIWKPLGGKLNPHFPGDFISFLLIMRAPGPLDRHP